MRKIYTPHAPTPAGHYSQAIEHHGLIFVSGQLPFDPATSTMVEGGIGPQTRQVLENIRAILKEAGSDLDKILKTTIYIPDMSLWGEVNSVYGEMLGDHYPARAVVPCGSLHYGALLEMEVIASV